MKFSSLPLQTPLFSFSCFACDIHLLFHHVFLLSHWHSTLYPTSCSISFSLRPYHCPTSSAMHHARTLNNTHTHQHPPCSPVLHFTFWRLSLQLQRCSQLASCQGLGAVYLWLCYHIALPMQLSPVRTKRNPVSYWPLMFNETRVWGGVVTQRARSGFAFVCVYVKSG